MRYYLGQCEYKWSHARTDVEQLWVRRELGDELFATVEKNGWCWILHRTNSQTLPADIYCRTDIYIDIDEDTPAGTLFALKYPALRVVASA